MYKHLKEYWNKLNLAQKLDFTFSFKAVIKMKTTKMLLNIGASLTKFGLVLLAFYLVINQNYEASICIWLQLIYFKLLELKK